MPPKKGTKGTRKPKTEEEDERMNQLVVQYNPEILESALKEFQVLIEAKCIQLQRDADFMITSLQHEFQCELFKLPKQVKEMSLKKFTEEFGCSIDAVTKNALKTTLTNGANSLQHSISNNNENRNTMNHALLKQQSQTVFQTPANNRKQLAPPSTLARPPREGEVILSANGSPLGEFTATVKKPARDPQNSKMVIPPTPGVYVPIKSTGEIVDIEQVDPELLTEEMKVDAINQMEQMMKNMQEMMFKLKAKV